MPDNSANIPRNGMFATVRNRHGVITDVTPTPYGSHAGKPQLHFVRMEYTDNQQPAEEHLLWEMEPGGNLLEPRALPNFHEQPMAPDTQYDPMLRMARWSATSPFLNPDGSTVANPLQQPIASPFHGAIQTEDYQRVPLLKALAMPRVNLLIADDVGLGKTVEAGLVLSELLLRRRIRRVLILTPASLRLQWRDEMKEKFALPFDLVDKQSTHKLRQQQGIDANPWRVYSRIIASYHYLRQVDVLEQFRSAFQQESEQDARLPWDLLIVDECHNLMPTPIGSDSDLCAMLRQLAPCFEHRLFLSATPHNGHTRSFTGLLEMLDPVRFTRSSELTPATRQRIQQVVVRPPQKRSEQRERHPQVLHSQTTTSAVLEVVEP